jgi:hypothetical protein
LATAGAFGGPNPLDVLTLLTPVSSPGIHSDGSAMGLRGYSLAGEHNEASVAATDFFSAEQANASAAEE